MDAGCSNRKFFGKETSAKIKPTTSPPQKKPYPFFKKKKASNIKIEVIL